MLEERLKAVEGRSYDIRDVVDLCLVPDKVIAPEFKGLEFHKNKETSFRKRHLTMYCINMATHEHDDKLLIHCF